ncbi:MAG TPA: AraC family transcriptional regulator [Rubrivivax sp.]|nr:AraC family transcriptional regulator [Rubrivivax sp.]
MPTVGALHSPAGLCAEEELWRQRVGAMRAVPRLMRELGADPRPVLAAAGLNESAFDLDENTIPYAAVGRLLYGGAQLTGLDHFGLLVGQAWELRSLGLLGQLVRHAATVRDALRCAVVYHHLNSQGGVVFVRERGVVAEFGYAIYHRGGVGTRQIYDAVLATLVNFMRELCGAGWVPSEVLLAHAAPADASPYRRLFRCPVRFNAELNALRFPGDWLDRPVPGADPALLRSLEAQANALAQPDLLERLRRSLRVLLLNRVASGDAVAEMLTLHRRTLNRRLEALGTTFRDVLEDVRFEAACQLLALTELSLDDIADALGYAGVSPFTRAFRRRAGAPPGQWRREANQRSAAPAGPNGLGRADPAP